MTAAEALNISQALIERVKMNHTNRGGNYGPLAAEFVEACQRLLGTRPRTGCGWCYMDHTDRLWLKIKEATP